MVHIVFFDINYVVCVKPRGVLSEGQGVDCLPKILAEELEQKGESGELYTVHRLDRDTEGLMIYARNKRAAARLSEQIVAGDMKKEYLAIVNGVPKNEGGELCDLLFYDRKKGKSYVVDRERKGVKKAILDYEVIKTQGERSLVRVRLHTGRTHQIRVQFASRGMPLVGDRRYGAPADQKTMALWSVKLSFHDPKSGELREYNYEPEITRTY